jgi:hypothetical protein
LFDIVARHGTPSTGLELGTGAISGADCPGSIVVPTVIVSCKTIGDAVDIGIAGAPVEDAPEDAGLGVVPGALEAPTPGPALGAPADGSAEDPPPPLPPLQATNARAIANTKAKATEVATAYRLIVSDLSRASFVVETR